MTLLTTWPIFTDDSGPGLDGTVVNAARLGSGSGGATMKAAIEALIHSATNPTVTPVNVIDEVVTARGSKASLDARLDICLNEDGTLKSQASLVTQTQAQSILGQGNLVANDDFRLWPGGDDRSSSQTNGRMPSYWTESTSGVGLSIARCGTGLGDTKRKVGDFSLKMTYGSGIAKVAQMLLSTAGFARADFLKGVTIGIGCWVWASASGLGYFGITDGATTTETSGHTGDSTWQWLSTTHAISASGTYLQCYSKIGGSGSAYFSGPTVVIGLLAPSGWVPCQILATGTLLYPTGTGDVAVGTKKFVFAPARPCLVTDVQLVAEVAPTGAAMIVDVNAHSGNSIAGPTAPTCATSPTGVLTGAYYYKISFIDGDDNESVLGTASTVVNPSSQKVDLSAIPVGGGTTAKRGVWRTKAGGSTYYRVTTINDNSTTTYQDNIADGSITELGTTLPYVSMFTTKPEMAIAAYDAGATPDGTYRYRCLGYMHGTTYRPGCKMSIDVDQVGSTEPGEDLKVEVRTLGYVRPQDRFNDYNNVGV